MYGISLIIYLLLICISIAQVTYWAAYFIREKIKLRAVDLGTLQTRYDAWIKFKFFPNTSPPLGQIIKKLRTTRMVLFWCFFILWAIPFIAITLFIVFVLETVDIATLVVLCLAFSFAAAALSLAYQAETLRLSKYEEIARRQSKEAQ